MKAEHSDELFRLDMDLDIDENIKNFIAFAFVKAREESDESIKNRHEAYGILAEEQALITKLVKDTNSDMNSMLKFLSDEETDTTNLMNTIYADVLKVVKEATIYCIKARKVLKDLHFDVQKKTPIEEYLDSVGSGTEQ